MNKNNVSFDIPTSSPKTVCVNPPEELIKGLRNKEIPEFNLPNEVAEDIQKYKISNKKISDTKIFLQNFKNKVEAPQHFISYEGSMVLLVLHSLNIEGITHNLPQIDQKLIREVVPGINSIFTIKLNEHKDFVLGFNKNDKQYNSYSFVNTVANPRTEDLKEFEPGPSIHVNENENKINIGFGAVEVDKTLVSKIINWDKKVSQSESNDQPPMINTVNKNAYEIRNDVLGMALDWVRFKKECNPQHPFSDEDLLSTTQKFYKFVENKK